MRWASRRGERRRLPPPEPRGVGARGGAARRRRPDARAARALPPPPRAGHPADRDERAARRPLRPADVAAFESPRSDRTLVASPREERRTTTTATDPNATAAADATTATPFTRASRLALFADLLRERILVLDGAMGTMIQRHQLDEADFRGERFRDHPRDLRGANDLLVADPARTSSAASTTRTSTPARTSSRRTRSTATRISMADYGLEPWVEEMNARRGPARPRGRGRGRGAPSPDRPRFVAGRARPDEPDRLASRPDVNDPGARNVTFDELAAAYHEAARGLVEGGADILLIETIFDTLNAQGRDLRRRGAVRGARRIELPVIDQRHDHRRVRADAVAARPSARSGTACATPGRSRSGSTARSARGMLRPYVAGAVAHRRRARSASTRTPACPTRSAATTSTPGDDGSSVLGELRPRGLRQHRRRLLRHDARPHRGDRGGGRRHARRGRSRASSRRPGCRASSRSTSARTRSSSTSASAPTSPARGASRKLILEGRLRPRPSRSRASRSRAAPR